MYAPKKYSSYLYIIVDIVHVRNRRTKVQKVIKVVFMYFSLFHPHEQEAVSVFHLFPHKKIALHTANIYDVVVHSKTPSPVYNPGVKQDI